MDSHRWSDKKPSSVGHAYLPPVATDVSEPKAAKPQSGQTPKEAVKQETETLVEDEAKEAEEDRMMREADCSAKKASTMDPLPSLNTTFHVDDNIHYSPKGPDPSEVVIVTAADGGGHNGGIEGIMDQTSANRKAYCQHHGYNCHFSNIGEFDLENAHPVWKKIPAIVEAFNAYPKAQWVFFLDLDAIIMSPKQNLNDLILSHAGLAKSLDFEVEWHRSDRIPLGVWMPNQQDVKFDEIDMLVAQDQNGINAGSFFLRRSKFTQWMLDMWADPFFMRHDWPGQEQDTLVRVTLSWLILYQRKKKMLTSVLIAALPQTSQSVPTASRPDQTTRRKRILRRRRCHEMAGWRLDCAFRGLLGRRQLSREVARILGEERKPEPGV
jgi:hypothetical protein